MKNKFKIFYVSPEVAPFASNGELGEAAGALPKVLKDLGHEVRMMMPNYRAVNERKYVLRDVIRLKDMPVELDGEVLRANGKSAFLPNSKVQIYFLDYKPYFDRPQLYEETGSGKGYPDNAERFIFFCRGCLETLKLLHWQPDVIHCNDWQTSLIPFFLKTAYRNDPFFKNTRVLLSVHDVTQQGSFEGDIVKKLGLVEKKLVPGSLGEHAGKFNFLKAGLATADFLSTVSETYAQEIQSSKQQAVGLEKLLRSRRPKIIGIPHGVDYSVWNPETDTALAATYGASNFDGKAANKQALLKQLGFEASPQEPVLAMVSSLREEKGIELILAMFDKLVGLGTKLIVYGTGDEKYLTQATKIAKRHAKHATVVVRRDESLLHLLIAGADMLLMPSRVEPCGFYHLVAMAYGTVPVVHAVGGLAETVENYNLKTGRGTGFVFDKYNGQEFLHAVQRGIKLMADENRWLRLVKNAMKQNLSWQASAERYVKLYQKLGSPPRL